MGSDRFRQVQIDLTKFRSDRFVQVEIGLDTIKQIRIGLTGLTGLTYGYNPAAAEAPNFPSRQTSVLVETVAQNLRLG